MLATFEIGCARNPLEFQVMKDTDGSNFAVSEDDLYKYRTELRDPVPGTLFIRNKRDGTLKAVTVSNMLEIQRESLIRRNDESKEDETYGQKIQSLVSNFGSRQAQRIQRLRKTNAK